MKVPSLKNIVLRLFPKTIVLYLSVCFLACLVFDCPEIIKRGQVKTLNRLMPELYLLKKLKNNESLKKRELNQFIFYYKNVIHSFPDASPAYSLLGYCYYKQGDKKKAFKEFKKAAELQEGILTYYYNLALLHYEYKNYDQAVTLLEKAIQTSLDKNLRFTTSTRFYFYFLDDENKVADQLDAKFKEAYFQAYKLLVTIAFEQKDYDLAYQHAVDAISFPRPEFFLYILGRVAFERKQYDEAYNYLKASLEKDSFNPDAMHFLGLTLNILGKKQLGKQALNQAQAQALVDLTKKAHQKPEPEFVPMLF